MYDNHNIQDEYDEIANDILDISRDTLLVNLRFMDMALSYHKREASLNICSSLASDGKTLFYNPNNVIKEYSKGSNGIVRSFMHTIFHCVYQHQFVNPEINKAIWDLACDIAVENTINDISIAATEVPNAKQQKSVVEILKKDLTNLTSEKIYRYYLDHNLTDSEFNNIRKVFTRDSHNLWYISDNQLLNGNNSNCNSIKLDNVEKQKVKDVWKKIANSMQIDINTFNLRRSQGIEPGSLTDNLKFVTREKYNYEKFLMQFAVMSEIMKINDDEFDYIFYTYGLSMYYNMPLIEPLEYKEVKKIREFVIAIDTSGSVAGDLVKCFLNKTYNIFKQEETFFKKFCIHIIQCDSQIQEDKLILLR